MYQPFEPVTEKLGVKIRSLEQAMVPIEAYISMVTGNSPEEDSETDDQSYIPPEVFALTWHADVGHIMHMAPRIAYIIHLICHQLGLDLLCVQCHLLGFSTILPPFLNICLFGDFNK